MAHGSNGVTTSDDLRSILMAGDTVELGSEQFEVIGVPDPSEFFINANWEGASSSDPFGVIHGARCEVPNKKDNLHELSCSIEVQGGSVTGRTTCDLTMEVAPGDRLRLCGETRQAASPIDPGTITLDRPWDRPAGRCKVLRFPSVYRRQDLMDALQARRMRCQSLYCLAKVEEEERAVAFAMDPTIPRSMEPDLNPEEKKRLPLSARAVIEAFAKAKKLEATAEITKTADDIAAAEAALNAAEQLEAATNLTASRTKTNASLPINTHGELNPSSKVALATRIDPFHPSGHAEDAAHALDGVVADRAIMDGKSFPSVQANGKVVNDPEGDADKSKTDLDASGVAGGAGSGTVSGSDGGSGSGSGSEEENPREGGGAAMAKTLKEGKDATPIAGAKDGVGSTFKWWLEEGIDHKYNNMMQSMHNLKPSGKTTHGGAIDDNDHAVEILAKGGLGAGKDERKNLKENNEDVGKTIKPGHAHQLNEKKKDKKVRDVKGAQQAIKKLIEDRIAK